MCARALYSKLYCVTGVSDDLFVETFSLFVVSRVSNDPKYCCRCVAAISCLGCLAISVRISACDHTFMSGCVREGMSWVKNVGESIIVFLGLH